MTSIFFDSTFCLRLAETLLHFLWQGTAIGLIVCAVRHLLPRAQANTRYALFISALFAMVACLPVTFFLLDPPAAQEISTVTDPIDTTPVRWAPESALVTTTPSEQPLPMTEQSLNASAPIDVGVTVSSPLIEKTRQSTWSPQIAFYITAAYFLGLALMLIRLLLASMGSRRVKRMATPLEDQSLLATAQRQAERMGLKKAPPIAYCVRVAVPMVVGVLKPIVLLPPSLATGLSSEEFEAVLAHELAHIRRWDLPWNVLQCFIEAVLFFHPAVWYVSRQVSLERETCCDDLVVSTGIERVRYAGVLIRLAELCLSAPSPKPIHSLAATGPHPKPLKRRILRLLAAEPRVGATRFEAALLAVSMAAAIGLCGFASSGAWAAAEPPPAAEQDVEEPKVEANERPKKTSPVVAQQPDAPETEIEQAAAAPDEMATFLKDIRQVLPPGWTMWSRQKAIHFRGPLGLTEETKEQTAEITFWFSDKFASSQVLNDRDDDLPKIGSWGVTRLGHALFTRNQAAIENWPEFLGDIYWFLPVDHVAFAGVVDLKKKIDDVDTIRNVMMLAGTRINVQIQEDGHRRNLTGLSKSYMQKHGVMQDDGISRRTKFLVVGDLPEFRSAKTTEEQQIAVRHGEQYQFLKKLAVANGVDIITLDDYVGYLQKLKQTGRADSLPNVRDGNRINVPIVSKKPEFRVPRAEASDAVGENNTELDSQQDKTSLAVAIADFNEKQQQDPIGKDQPPLTEDEVLATILRAKLNRDQFEVADEQFASYQEIAETRRLPAGAEFEVLTGFQTDAFTLFRAWSVRIVLPKPDGGSYGFPIRDRWIKVRQIDEKSIAWGKPGENGIAAGVIFEPSAKTYRPGDTVRPLVFLRNEGESPVEIPLPNAHFFSTKDIQVTDQNGTTVAVKKGHKNFDIQWLSGGRLTELRPGGSTELRVPFKIRIGDGPPDKEVGRVIEAAAGGTYRIRFVLPNSGSDKRGDQLLTDFVTFEVKSQQREPSKNEGAVKASRTAPQRAWQSIDPYQPPNFKKFFPDDVEGGKRLDELFANRQQITLSDDEILNQWITGDDPDRAKKPREVYKELTGGEPPADL